MKKNDSITKWNKFPSISEDIGASPFIIAPLVLPPGIITKNPDKNPLSWFMNFLAKKTFRHIFVKVWITIPWGKIRGAIITGDAQISQV